MYPINSQELTARIATLVDQSKTGIVLGIVSVYVMLC